ncbi:MAG: hypothetical protein V1656_00720 [Candidatus Jorgensenbacteria bacterium]
MPGTLDKLRRVVAEMEEELHGDLRPADQERQPAPPPKPPEAHETTSIDKAPESLRNAGAETADAKTDAEQEQSPESEEDARLKKKREAYAKALTDFQKRQKETGLIVGSSSHAILYSSVSNLKNASNIAPEKLKELLKETHNRAPIFEGDANLIDTYDSMSEEEQASKRREYLEASGRKNQFILELYQSLDIWRIAEALAEALYDVEARKIDYEYEKNELAYRLRAEKEIELRKNFSESGNGSDTGLSEEEKTKFKEQLDHYAASEIFEKVVVEEYEALERARIESRPPRERGTIESVSRAFAGWWTQRHWLTRVAISTAVITAGIAVTPGLGFASLSATAGYAGFRGGRGALSILMGQGAGKGFDWTIKGPLVRMGKKELAATREALGEEFKEGLSSINVLRGVEERYSKAREKLASTERRLLYAKGAVMMGSGMGTAMLAGHYLGTPKIGEVTGEPAPGKPSVIHAKPSPSPIASPTPHPEVSPSPTPEPSPSPTARPSPEISPSPKPSSSPQIDHETSSQAKIVAEPKSSPKPTADTHPSGVPRTETSAQPVGTKEIAEAEKESAELDNAAEIRKGEGAWQAVRRQLAYRLEHHPDKFAENAHMKLEDVERMAKTEAGRARLLDGRTAKILIDEKWASNDATPTSGTLKGVYYDNRLEEQAKLILTDEDKIVSSNPKAVFDVHETPSTPSPATAATAVETEAHPGPVWVEVPLSTTRPTLLDKIAAVPPELEPDMRLQVAELHKNFRERLAATAAAGGRQDLWIIGHEMKLSPERLQALHKVTAYDLLAESHVPKEFLRLKNAIAALHLAEADQKMTIQNLFEQRGTELRYAFEHKLDFKHPLNAEMLVEEATKDHGSWLRRILHLPKDDYQIWAKGKTGPFVKTMLEKGEGRVPKERFLLARAIADLPSHDKAFYDINKMTLKELFKNATLRGEIVRAYAKIVTGA